MHDTASHPAFADFAGLAAHLDHLGLFRMKPGLDRIRAVLGRLGLTRPPFTVVQVAGTNGKGSVSTMLARLAEGHSLRAGLHTSPHFCSVRERIRINRTMLPEEDWTEAGNTLMQNGGSELTYFEFVTCLAVLAFARENVDLAVLESGLGGSFDATTALEADLVVFTPIDLDHQAVLGPTIRAIAADKAGAVRAGRPALTGPQAPEAVEELEAAARAGGAALHNIPGGLELPFAAVPCPPAMRLKGRHQEDNARLALAAWRLLKNGVLPGSAAERVSLALRQHSVAELETDALARAWLPGRMQFVPPVPAPVTDQTAPPGLWLPCALGRPPLLLDGAHNSHGLEALGRSLAAEGVAPAAVVFSCLEDKDIDRVVPLLRALATGPIFVPPVRDNPRAACPEALARKIGLSAVPVPSLREALEAASTLMAERLPEAFAGERPKNPLLICGSLYLLGEAFCLMPDCLEDTE